jgi:hypothetical protein
LATGLVLAAALLVPFPGGAETCNYSISPPWARFDRWHFDGEVTVTGSPSGCTGSWSSVSHSDWIEIVRGGSGSGEGPFTLGYTIHAQGPRTGALTVAGSVFSVYVHGYYLVDQCFPGPTTLCIDDVPGDGRFRVEVEYQSVLGGGVEGRGNALPLGSLGVGRGGLFWFFSPDNPEVLIKILDGCGVNGHFWLFSSAATNLGMMTMVTDTVLYIPFVFLNPDLQTAVPVATVTAFPCQ